MGSSVFLTGLQSRKEGRIPQILHKDLAISLCKTCSVSLREILTSCIHYESGDTQLFLDKPLIFLWP